MKIPLRPFYHFFHCKWSGFGYRFLYNDGVAALCRCDRCGHHWMV